MIIDLFIKWCLQSKLKTYKWTIWAKFFLIYMKKSGQEEFKIQIIFRFPVFFIVIINYCFCRLSLPFLLPAYPSYDPCGRSVEQLLIV